MDILIERADGTLTVQVRDDGVGSADTTRGSGLVGLRDRVEAVGGTMTLDSPARAGTVLTVRLPVTAEDHLSERTVVHAPPGASAAQKCDLAEGWRGRHRAGICPVAMAPITVPMKNGVSSEEKAKVAPMVRCTLSPSTSLRKAKPAPVPPPLIRRPQPDQKQQTPGRSTITSKHRWISYTTRGRSAGGTLSQPMTCVPGPNPTSSDWPDFALEVM